MESRQALAHINSFPARELHLFKSLDVDNKGSIQRKDLEKALRDVGLSPDDVRLKESMSVLRAYEEKVALEDDAAEVEIPLNDFSDAIRKNILLIERALQGNLVIPDFMEFSQEISKIYDITKSNTSGKVADYIPQLELKGSDADKFGVALTTIDGQQFAVGDAQDFFTIQSVSKPVLYALALEEHGAEKVHTHVGHEPSGASFNELALNEDGLPHNPMINAGAIMSSALIKLSEAQKNPNGTGVPEINVRGWAGTRLDYVMERWQALSGGEKPRFSSPVYLSERQTADRNFALGYFMREKGAFPEGVDLLDVLDFYFQNCSLEMTAEMLSVVAATLANGGICPTTGERIFSSEAVQHTLSLMSSCGMYDYSGEFAFKIGLPAKSGVSGAVMIVVPNVMGICTWSPRLDEHGNSVRGIEFSQHLVETFNIHNFDSITGASSKQDPRYKKIKQTAKQVNELIWAASKGDLQALQEQVWRGADLNIADYDLRTPLHLAAAEGQAHVAQFFIEQDRSGINAIQLNPRDRWGGTPLDDAYRHGHQDIVEMLRQNGGDAGKALLNDAGLGAQPTGSPSDDEEATVELIWAASVGNLSEIRRLVAQGTQLGSSDYDLRTPLHLAAAEGHVHVVKYLLDHGVEINPRDRWGGTPLDDAFRHNQKEVIDLLHHRGGLTTEAAIANSA